MPKIPNAPTAGFPDQAEPDSIDFEIIDQGILGDGVLSGCAVTAQGTPDGTVAVAVGSVRIGGTIASVSGGNVTIPTGGASPRFDLVAVDNAGVKSRIAGTESTNPVFPAIPANSVILAAVFVPAGDAIVNANQITDKRTFVNQASLAAANTFTGTQRLQNYLDVDEMTAPAAPAANIGRLFVRDSGGKTEFCVRFATGAIVILATENTAREHLVANLPGTAVVGAGTTRFYNKLGRTLTMFKAWASVGTAPTGASLIVDVNKGGTTIFTTQASRPTIAVSTNFAESAAPDVTTWADGDFITFDVDQVGSTVAGSDLVVALLVA